MGDGLDEEQLKVWRSFLDVNTRMVDVLDQRLRRRHSLALTDYEILTMLAEADGHRLRMSDLASRVLVSRSRLTYRIDQLSKRGVVERVEDQNDGRGTFASLTDDGVALLVEATPLHAADVKSILFDHLSDLDLKAFQLVLQRIQVSLAG